MKAADGVQIAERYVGWYKALIHERVSDIKQKVTSEDVVPLIEELSRAEEALISSGFKPSEDGKLWVPPVNEVATKLYREKFAAEERERVLREALNKYEPIIIELAGRSKEAFSTIDGAMSRLIADAQNATDKRPASEWPFAALTAAPEQGKEAKS